MRRFRFSYMLALAATLSLGTRWSPGQATYTAQERFATASASASFAGQTDDDAQTFDAPDFGVFDVSPNAAASVEIGDNGASAYAGAAQTSELLARRIAASGSAGGQSDSYGSGAVAETDAESYFSATFLIDEAYVSAALQGSISSTDFGQAEVTLTGPGGILFTDFVQASWAAHDLNEPFLLTPGTYTLTIRAFADSAASEWGSDDEQGGFDLTLSMSPGSPDCNANGVPDVFDVLGTVYAVTDHDHGLYETLDPNHTGSSWELVGSMGGGITSAGALTRDPLSGQWYVMVEAGGTQQLGTLDPNTAAVHLIGPLSADPPPDDTFRSMAFGPDGTLYVVYTTLGALGVLGRVDPATAGVTSVAFINSSFAYSERALAGRPGTSLLYYAYGDALETIDLDTLEQTVLVASGGPVWTALAFDRTGDTLLGATRDHEITTIDPQTGQPNGMLHPSSLAGATTGLLYRPTSADINRDGIPDECSPPGDIDDDGDVDLSDLARLLAAFGSCVGDPAFDPAADVNADGCVTLADLSILLADYGMGA